MPITLLDGIVLAVTLFSAVLAMVRGFSREVLAVASWVAAAAAAYFFYPALVHISQDYTGSEKIAMIGSAAVIFLITLIVVSYITMRIADFIIDSRVGALDRTLGFVVWMVLLWSLDRSVAAPQQPDWVAEAKSKPMLDTLGARLVSMLPEDADAEILNRLKGLSGDEEAPSVDEAADPASDQAAGTAD